MTQATPKTKELTLQERTKVASDEISDVLKKYNLGIQAVNLRPEVQFVDMNKAKDVEVEKVEDKAEKNEEVGTE